MRRWPSRARLPNAIVSSSSMATWWKRWPKTIPIRRPIYFVDMHSTRQFQPDGMSVRQSPSGFRQTASPNPTGVSCAERYGIIASVRLVRRTRAWWSKSPSVALLRIACRPRSTPRPAFRSIGSSTWSPARSKSTRSQGPMVTELRDDYGPGQSVPVVLDGIQVGTIAVADILP